MSRRYNIAHRVYYINRHGCDRSTLVRSFQRTKDEHRARVVAERKRLIQAGAVDIFTQPANWETFSK